MMVSWAPKSPIPPHTPHIPPVTLMPNYSTEPARKRNATIPHHRKIEIMASEASIYAEDNAFHTQEPPKQAPPE